MFLYNYFEWKGVSMKNKRVQAMLVTTMMSAALIGGCAFDPAAEEMNEVYGPAMVTEEQTEDTVSEEEQTTEDKTEEEEPEENFEKKDDFSAEEEVEVCVYGPAPTE